MSKIDEVFYIFGDRREHRVSEMAKAVFLPKYMVRKVLSFLAEFNFIEYDRGNEMAKASSQGMEILSRENKLIKSPASL